MKTIKISVIALVGIILIVFGFTMGLIAYYNYKNTECINNPVDYANNYSNNYWWDSVTAISSDYYG